MVGSKAVLLLGIVCFAAYVSAQDMAMAAPESGTYLVNGTGVVYDGDKVTFFLNGTSVGTVPNPKADGPTPYDPHKDKSKDGKDDKDKKDDKDDKANKDDKADKNDKDHPFLDLPKPGKSAPSPDGDSENVFDDISKKSKTDDNPLYNVVLGRRLMH